MQTSFRGVFCVAVIMDCSQFQARSTPRQRKLQNQMMYFRAMFARHERLLLSHLGSQPFNLSPKKFLKKEKKYHGRKMKKEKELEKIRKHFIEFFFSPGHQNFYQRQCTGEQQPHSHKISLREVQI